MAKKENPRAFKPGQSGNPNGRPPLPPDLKGARQLNKIELERMLNECIYLSASEIKSQLQDPTTPAIRLIVLKIVGEAISKGDEKRLNFLLDRLIGAVKKEIDLGGEGIEIVIRDYMSPQNK